MNIIEHYFNLSLYVWIALAIIIFFILLKITVPYGRHTTTKWGATVSNKWGWFIMEFPALVVISWFFFSGKTTHYFAAYIVYGLYMLHYFRRTFIFPFQLHDNGKKMPWVIVILGIFFNVVNGFFNGYWLGHMAGDYYNDWVYHWQFFVGIILFATGMTINILSDQKLLNLRKGGKKGYFIPKGGLFEYISSPNLFGEVIEWLGWAVVAWNLPALSFFIWTIANLTPRALDHHRWYKNKFADYPKKRKAVFPFVL